MSEYIFYKSYVCGDMDLHYLLDEEDKVGLLICPADLPIPENLEKKADLDPLVQLKVVGDNYPGGYGSGNTMRGSATTRGMHLKDQSVEESEAGMEIRTVLEDSRGIRAVHILTWEKGDPFVRIRTEIENGSQNTITLEMLSSFSLTGISPYLPGDCSGEMVLHRLQSRWSQEGRLLSQTLEELQLEPSWAMGAVRCERFGQAGSMPVNHYFPFAALEDTKNHVFFGAQISHQASWQMEVYRRDENIALSGGLADREFGHWMKNLLPGESFTSPEAIVSAAHTDSLDAFCQRLTRAGEKAVNAGPASEQDLPIIFNEYCTTWGCPSHENITGILKALHGKGIEYFVIDCGWYKADGVPWSISMGDYIPSDTLFPEGLERTVEAIHQEGMKAGIWFELENAGPASKAYQNTDHLLKRDGVPLTTESRRFWDMRDPWVQNYLEERVIGTLKKYGFDYMKIDYNDTIGIGCDGAESLGEGLRQNMAASMEFVEEVKREVPGIILENCASGGHRLEPGWMAAMSMASFSDAHECVEIPIIAANLHRAILPRQSQIWAVIRESDSLKRIAYSIANTFLGRMCLSGDVTGLTPEQWDVIDRGMAFYKKIAPVIKEGETFYLTPQVEKMRHPSGWQAILRVGENGDAFVVMHTFAGPFPEVLEVKLPSGSYEIEELYSDEKPDITLENGKLTWRPGEEWRAAAVYLRGDSCL